MASGVSDRVVEEVGDLLFAVANLSRHLGVEPEAALSQANAKFSERFRALETHFQRDGRALRDVPSDEMEHRWSHIKREGGGPQRGRDVTT